MCDRESKETRRTGGVNGMCVFYETGVLNLLLVIGEVHQMQRARPKLHEDTYNDRDALIRTKWSRQKRSVTKKKKNQNEYKFIPIIIYVASAGDGFWQCVCCGVETWTVQRYKNYAVICGQHPSFGHEYRLVPALGRIACVISLLLIRAWTQVRKSRRP